MENFLNPVLERYGLSIEDLTTEEIETYKKNNFMLQELTVVDIKKYLEKMILSIALKLSQTPTISKDYEANINLKARLQNYITLYSYILRPEEAEKAFREGLERVKQTKLK